MSKEKIKYEMILYRCPYCGSAQLKEIVEVQNHDTWTCLMCKVVMKPA